MNVAVILAGGTGQRTAQDVPKQFLNIFDKPILIHTLECFQNHPEIDGIIVSVLEGWENVLKAYATEFGVNKLRWIITGGENGQASARKALLALEEVLTSNEDIVIIHDGVRPYLEGNIISDAISKCKEYGSGLSAIKFQETVMTTSNGINGSEYLNKDSIIRVMTPQAYPYKKALWAHKEAINRGITNATYTNTLMMDLGETLYYSAGSGKNIKITTSEDIDIFKALYITEKEDWLK